jgi:cytochrome c oxidase assembly protein subunit 15
MMWRCLRGSASQMNVPTSTATGTLRQLQGGQRLTSLRFMTSFSSGSEALTHGLSDGARRQMAWWLGGTGLWVYSMVVLGGVTRLTRSGLSMTEWKFTGERPPLTQEDWRAEYDKYRASPEFKKVHSSMAMDEFKFIFWMEYAHRMWGRFLGLAFVLPGAYFLSRGYMNGAMGRRLGLLFFMGGTQGLVGWWMVRSGLVEPSQEHQKPRVSPYRLAAHLVSAFSIYSVLVWTTLDLIHPKTLLSTAGAQGAISSIPAVIRSRLLPFSALVALTATSGAFVAGLDAGRAFNTFPLMQGQWFPDEYWGILPGSRVEDVGLVRNAFENTAAAQWHHRILATSTAAGALALWAWVASMPSCPSFVRARISLVAGVTLVQFGLGIWTLLEAVPVALGSAHQANALNLFTAVLVTLHALRPTDPSLMTRALSRASAPAALAFISMVAVGVTMQK